MEAVMRGCILANASDRPPYVDSVMSGAAAEQIKRRHAKARSPSARSHLPRWPAKARTTAWVHSAAYLCTLPLREAEQDNLLCELASGALETAPTTTSRRRLAPGASATCAVVPGRITHAQEIRASATRWTCHRNRKKSKFVF